MYSVPSYLRRHSALSRASSRQTGGKELERAAVWPWTEFADTGYWIALQNPREDLHQKASATSRDYTPNQIVTSEMVLTEFLNSFSDYGPGLCQEAARAVVSLVQWT